MTETLEPITRGSGDVLADLGLSQEHRTKAALVDQLREAIRDKGLTQAAAAKRIGVDGADLSRVLNGKFRQVSIERLMQSLARLDMEVDITVRPRGGITGRVIHFIGA